MKTNSLKALVAMFGLLATINMTSCKDDDAQPDNTQVLTDGNWKLTALTSDPAFNWFGTPVTNIYAQLPACIKDDLTTFKESGTVNFDEGASKCDPNDPQTTSGTWAFSTDEKILSVTTDGETESWNIEALEDDIFKAHYEITEEGLTYTFTITFSKN
ncbi:MAG: lipocalin family protein [Saprospiraceae bacterium]|nr:lipocalin family protein [Saprospiraceae bacterium]